MRMIIAALLACLVATPGFAHVRRHHHSHRHIHLVRRHDSHPASVISAQTDAGPIVVAKVYADRFVGFINALVADGYKPKDIGCYAPTGHIRNSEHHWGGACDIDQKERNVTAKFMYHVTELAHKFKLEDGCEWRHPDCGHIQVPQASHVAINRRRHYAHHGHHHYG